MRRIERVGVVTAWALRIEGTGMGLTAPLLIEGTSIRRIEVHCGSSV